MVESKRMLPLQTFIDINIRFEVLCFEYALYLDYNNVIYIAAVKNQ